MISLLELFDPFYAKNESIFKMVYEMNQDDSFFPDWSKKYVSFEFSHSLDKLEYED